MAGGCTSAWGVHSITCHNHIYLVLGLIVTANCMAHVQIRILLQIFASEYYVNSTQLRQVRYSGARVCR